MLCRSHKGAALLMALAVAPCSATDAGECGTRDYDLNAVDSYGNNAITALYRQKAGIPHVPIRVGTPRTMKGMGTNSFPADEFDWTGVWWMKGNPVPEELVSFDGMECTPADSSHPELVEKFEKNYKDAFGIDCFANNNIPLSCTIPNGQKHQWSWDTTIQARFIQYYYAWSGAADATLESERMSIDFCNKTFGEVHTGLKNVPLVWVERFGFFKTNADQWLRPTTFQAGSPWPDTDYQLTRVLDQDGVPVPKKGGGTHWDDFLEYMKREDTGLFGGKDRKIRVFDSDNAECRKCMLQHQDCGYCRAQCNPSAVAQAWQQLTCTTGSKREITLRDSHTSCGSLPSCPAGWTMLSVADKLGCKDEATCGGCCTQTTKQLQGYWCGTCQSGWVETNEQVSWTWWGKRTCKVTCGGCDGTWSSNYGHAAARDAEVGGGDSSAPRIIAAACALLLSAVAALVIVHRRRQSRLSAVTEVEEPLTLCVGDKAEIDI